ncbi:MAG: hypothetical protein HY569_01655 [Candidatus Magasanikbacteria bacterium]|nr:hypothetical protein [Candidatus Magasanikbacteria bacterium]
MEREHAIDGAIDAVREREKYHSKTVLEWHRHGLKDGDKLSLPGREKAAAESAESRILVNRGVPTLAIGSDKLRTQETAGLLLHGDKLEPEFVTAYENVDGLVKKINADYGVKVGTKIAKDKRLGFNFAEGEYKTAAYAADGRKEFLKWTVEESDSLAEKCGDRQSSSYRRIASSVSEFVLKYVQVEKNFDRLLKRKRDEDVSLKQEIADTMQRIVVSHSGVIDVFLAKVIEDSKGINARDEFVKALGDSGFAPLEGFSMEIITNTVGSEPIIKIDYDKKDDEGKIVFSFHESMNSEFFKRIVEAERK